MLLRESTLQISKFSLRWPNRLQSRMAIALTAVLVGLTLSSAPAQAANTLVVSGTAQATSSVGSSIVSGDTFTWSFTLNLDSTTTKTNINDADTFNNAVTAFTLSSDSNNVGTWSPSGVTWLISPIMNLVTNSISDQLTLQVQASNAPQIDRYDFFDLGITLDWAPGVVDVQPVSGSETLGAALGTFTPSLESATYFFELRDIYYSSANFVASAGQNQDDSGSTGSPVNSPQRLELMLETTGGLICSTPLATGAFDTWVQLPSAASCTAPTDRAGTTLLGWSTSATFPVDVARDQVSKGWGSIDSMFNGQRMIFIPAGNHTLITGGNSLHAIWG